MKVEGAKLHGKVGKLLRQTMSFYVIRFHDYAQIKSDEYDSPLIIDVRVVCTFLSLCACLCVKYMYVFFCMHYSYVFIMFFRCMLDVCKFIPCYTSIFYLCVYLSIFLSIYIVHLHNDVFIDMINHS